MSLHAAMSDQQLVESYRQHSDGDAVAEIFQRYHRVILFVCMKYMRNGQEAEDVAYETFCRFQTAIRTSTVFNAKGWLYQTARNECLMRLRDRVHEFESLETLEERENFDVAQRPDAENVDVTMAEPHLEEALAELDRIQQHCIRLFYYEKKTRREIAERLNMTTDQVRSALQNGKRMLHMILERKVRRERLT